MWKTIVKKMEERGVIEDGNSKDNKNLDFQKNIQESYKDNSIESSGSSPQNSKLQGCFTVSKNGNSDFDISCQLKPGMAGKVPESQQRLYTNVEFVCSILRNLSDTDSNIKEKYFEKLLSLAQVGLVMGETETANKSLEKLQDEVLWGEGARIKNKYMTGLGKDALIGGLILFVAFLFDYFLLHTSVISCISLIGIGAFAGVFVSFGARKFDIKFEELAIPEKDMMSKPIRLVYTFVATLIFCLLLLSGVLEVRIGSFETKDLLTSPIAQLTVGSICGLIESRLGIKVYNRAESIIGK